MTVNFNGHICDLLSQTTNPKQGLAQSSLEVLPSSRPVISCGQASRTYKKKCLKDDSAIYSTKDEKTWIYKSIISAIHFS